MGDTHGAGLGRDLALLRTLAGHDGLTVTRLAALTGRQQSQVSRALAALAAEGMVERDPRTREYSLGWRLYALAAGTTEARLATIAGHTLRGLAASTRAAAHLCRLHGTAVATVLSAPAGGGAPVPRWDLSDVPVHNTSAGRVLIGDLPEEQIAALAPRSDVDGLLGVVRRVRVDGFAVVDGEFTAALAGASAPVRDVRGAIVAAINVSGPAGVLRPRLRRVASATARAAEELSADLGYRPASVTGPR